MHTVSVVNIRILLLLTIFTFGMISPESTGAIEPTGLKTVAVIGNGDVYRDSISTARENAIADSLVSAVRSVVADLLPIDALVNHFPTLNQILFEQTRQYIQDYKVLTEFKYGRKYRVLVQATVMVDKVVTQLSGVGIIMEEKLLPRILFFITEENPENTWPQYWWEGGESSLLMTSGELALARIMGDRGYAIVDHGLLPPAVEKMIEPVIYKSNLSDTEATGIGSLLGAEVIVIGASKAGEALNTKGDDLKSFKGTVAARAIRTDTGEEIATTIQTALAVNTDETAGGRAAIAAAGDLAAEVLAEKISGVWGQKERGPEIVEVILSGTRDLVGFVKLRKIMSSTPGVRGIQVREIGVNNATIWVNYEGDTDALATALVLNDFESFGIHISDISSGHLGIDIIQAAKPSTPEPQGD